MSKKGTKCCLRGTGQTFQKDGNIYVTSTICIVLIQVEDFHVTLVSSLSIPYSHMALKSHGNLSADPSSFSHKPSQFRF